MQRPIHRPTAIWRRINTKFNSTAPSTETKEWVREYLAADAYQIEYQYAADPAGRERFVLEYLQHERARQRDRDRPLCTCGMGSACPVLDGRLPREMRRADTLQAGVQRFRQQHNGAPVVLREALREYARLEGRVVRRLREALTALDHDETYPDLETEGYDAAPVIHA